MSHHAPIQHSFAGGAHTPLNHTTPVSEHDRLTQQTQKWVAQTFFATLLKQMRNSPFKSKLFEGGRGGEAFGELYDQKLAEHMSRGAGTKLVHSIVSRIEAQKAYGKSMRREKHKTVHGINPTRQGRANDSATFRA
jgi:Rod binding domain-containing protein